MPDARGRTGVSLPADVMERVRLMQAQLEEEGIRLTTGLVVCHLVDVAYACKTQHKGLDVSSTAQ